MSLMKAAQLLRFVRPDKSLMLFQEMGNGGSYLCAFSNIKES